MFMVKVWLEFCYPSPTSRVFWFTIKNGKTVFISSVYKPLERKTGEGKIWELYDLPPGTILIRLRINKGKISKKMLIIHSSDEGKTFSCI